MLSLATGMVYVGCYLPYCDYRGRLAKVGRPFSFPGYAYGAIWKERP